jgi:ATP-dependent helicase/nuclease subunit A
MNQLTPHQKAALNFDHHISLTANAGSGKTTVLADRYLEIALTDPDLNLNKIVAITFTDKAAGELYTKITRRIDEMIIAANERELKKLEVIRSRLVSANISTIHSFCIDILREFPVESRIDANFKPIDETLSKELIELATDEVIKSFLRDDNISDKLKYLIRIFSSKKILADEIRSLIGERKNVLALKESLYIKNEKDIAEYFHEQFISGVKKLLFDAYPEILKDVETIVETVLVQDSSNEKALIASSLLSKIKIESSVEDLIPLYKELFNTLFTGKGTIRVQGFLKKDKVEGLRKQISCASAVNDLVHNFEISTEHREVEIELAKFGKTILFLFDEILSSYSAKKEGNGYLDYEDILLLTRNVLKSDSVRKKLADKYNYLMIDEYQDTNELQYGIFLPILNDLKKGNLFVVGDEKQSIYMFRDAELEVFNKTKEDIKSVSGEKSILTLPESFRMSPAICLFVNHLFSKLFTNPNPAFNEVFNSEIVCGRSDSETGTVEFLLAEEDKNSTQDVEAELVAKKLLNIIHEQGEKLKWSDIAVLVRKRKAFGSLEKIFLSFGIPFSIIGGRGFYQRQSVYDIYNYFSFLLNPDNDSALVGILRSPFFGFSDTEIYQISTNKGKNYLIKLYNYVLENQAKKKYYNVLSENISLAENVNATYLLRKILIESGYLSVISALPGGEQERANIEKLINLTNKYFEQGFRTLYDYVDYLKNSIESYSDEAQAAPKDESNSVKVMTIHQAKGLEFKAVFLFRCSENTPIKRVKGKSIVVDKNFGFLTTLPVKENYFEEYQAAPIIQLHNYISEKKHIAELKRLLYVACTRAINSLYISATISSSGNLTKNSFIEVIFSGLNLDPSQPEFSIDSNLTLLKKSGDKYSYEEKPMQLIVPLIRSVQPVKSKLLKAQERSLNFDFMTNTFSDNVEGEFISATKLNVFQQCPLKYQLVYEWGAVDIYNDYKNWLNKTTSASPDIKDYQLFNLTEDEEETVNIISKTSPEIIGTIAHRILEKEILPEKLDDVLNTIIASELKGDFTRETDSDLTKKKVEMLLREYYNSETYRELKSYRKFYNEYQIYLKENDYFLFGIIDKLIIEKDKIIIVDYKTDEIDSDKIQEKAIQYLSQLKFYSYIASAKYSELDDFNFKIIFLHHPDKVVNHKTSRKELREIGKQISEMVQKVRSRDFVKNLLHCPNCHFAVKGNCIKK